MRTKRALAAAAAMIATAGMLLSGCASGANSSGPVTVTMWARSATGGITKALVQKFNAEQKKIKIDLTVLPLNEEDAKFAAAARSGSVPDIFGMNDISVPSFVRTGALRPLDDFINGRDYKAALNPGQISLSSYQGKVYGVPLMLDLSVLWYNKDLFQKAGLDPNKAPASAQEILDDARKITALGGDVKGFTFGGNCGGCLTFSIEPMIFATKENVIQGDIGKQKVHVQGNKALRDVMQLLQTLWKEGLTPASDKTEDGATWGQDFLSGKVGIMPAGIGTILASQNKSFQLGIGGLPAPDGSAVSTFSGGDVFVLPTKGQHVKEAETFIDWVQQPAQQNMYPAQGFTPGRTDILTDAFKKKNPYFAVALAAAATGYAPKTVAFQAIYSNTGPWGPMWQKAIFDGDINGALSSGQKAITDVLTPLDTQQ